MTVNVWPAITAVPDLSAASDGATLKETVPGPAPSPGSSVSQGTLLAAVHGQAVAVATVIDPLPPLPPAACEEGVMLY